MAIFKSLSLVCDKYNVSEEVEIMIEENIQKILFMKGWTEMKSFDKQAQKMKKIKRDCQIEYYPFGTLEWVTPCQTFNLTCFDTIHNLYLQNPTLGFYGFIENRRHYPDLNELVSSETLGKRYHINKIITADITGLHDRRIKLSVDKTISELRKFIKENTDYCQKNKLKQSLKKDDLVRIIIHGDPKGKIKK